MYDLVSSFIIIIKSKKRFKELLQDTYIKKMCGIIVNRIL